MSGHGHHDDHAVHDDHTSETTSDDFPADEPRSPGWLPLLGGAVFLAGILGYMAFGSDDKGTDQAAQAAAPAPDRPAPPPGAARRPAPGIPPGAALPPNHPRPPAQ